MTNRPHVRKIGNSCRVPLNGYITENDLGIKETR